ncbi:hypothetical protein CZ797_17980 [Pseudoalteromonas sp. JB197]|nr:hypothetical protein CZ797_17980 [Pseudoalteromonas sp. JB197]
MIIVIVIKINEKFKKNFNNNLFAGFLSVLKLVSVTYAF